MSEIQLSVIGLGKLGTSIAAAIASRGFRVIGVDVNHKAVELLKAGKSPVQETGLDELIDANRDRLTATLNHHEAVERSDVSFVVVPTPSDENGAFSLQYAVWAFREIGRALHSKDGYHTIVLTSTVLPGSTRYGLLPLLEDESGKRVGSGFGLCYSPAFVALGSVVRDFLNPDFTLVGESDPRAGDQLEQCYASIMLNNPPCKRMSLENAELTKIAVNTFVTTKIAFANMLADLCENIPGGDIDVVSDALGMDKRIGRKYLTGGLGYGGPCFPRDNQALSFLSHALGTNARLAETTDSSNRALIERIAAGLRSEVSGKTVAVLGLAYKPSSHVLDESQGVLLAQALSKFGARVVGFDPLAGELAQAELGDQILVLDSIDDCVEQADIVLLTNPDPFFLTLDSEKFRDKTVIDFWRILDKKLSRIPEVRYIPFGRSTRDEANAQRLTVLWNSACGSLQIESLSLARSKDKSVRKAR